MTDITLNATTLREITVPSISGHGGHVVPRGTRVYATREGDSTVIGGPEVKATMYVEHNAVRMDADGRERIYFAVADHYTIGREFDSYAEAVEHARSTIDYFEDLGRHSRAFVDVRVNDNTGDRSIHRVEIFPAKQDAEVTA